jgi:hypothetical protein
MHITEKKVIRFVTPRFRVGDPPNRMRVRLFSHVVCGIFGVRYCAAAYCNHLCVREKHLQ